MPYYASLSPNTDKPIAEGLLRLKDGLDLEGPPPRSLSQSLLLATWNIRDFNSTKFGARGREPLFYLAEIINRFDLVAIQEVRDDLTALRKLMQILEGWWKVVFTDVAEDAQGNRESMAFLFDARKINHDGLASEVVIPPEETGGKTLQPARRLARTPFLLGFQAGWFKFALCTAHIIDGKDRPDEPQRIEEINLLARFLAARAKERYAGTNNLILLGDFNIRDTTDATLGALTGAGFNVPDQIKKLPSNAPRTKHYDQFALHSPQIQDRLKLSRAGVFPVFDYVYRDGDEKAYAGAMGEGYVTTQDGKARDDGAKTSHYREWRTYQMSDHYPMWIELQTDFSREYLMGKLQAGVVAQ